MAGYGLLQTPPTEEEIILNSRLAQLYNHEFEHGRFFQVVFENEHEVGVRLSTRTLLKVVYIKDKEDIEGIELIKLVDGRTTTWNFGMYCGDFYRCLGVRN